jgi:hypothetical protein
MTTSRVQYMPTVVCAAGDIGSRRGRAFRKIHTVPLTLRHTQGILDTETGGHANKETTMASKREWTEGWRDGMTEVAGRALFVEDGTVGHYARLGEGDTVGAVLADYAAGYDCDPQTVTVRWHFFEGGAEVGAGGYVFEVR